MREETGLWLHEAHIALDSSKRLFTDASSMSAPACGNFCEGVEKTLKAVIVEGSGSTPGSYYSHDVAGISHTIGLWEHLPQSYKTLLTTVTSLWPNTRYPSEKAYITLVNSISPQQWEEHFLAAQGFKEFVETQVVPNPVFMAGLKL